MANPAENEIIRTLLPFRERRSALNPIWYLEDLCTPLEFAEALRARSVLAPDLQRALLDLKIAGQLVRETPRNFSRLEIASDITLYRDRSIPPEKKSLVIVFCGKSNRIQMPNVTFIQFIDSRRFDLVILKDRQHLFYQRGIGIYAGSLLELTLKLATDLDKERYRRTLTFGGSMAGLAALRAGILLDAERAISISGRFGWHVQRLLNKEKTLPAFDLLCHCVAPSRTRLIMVHAPLNTGDHHDFEILAGFLPVENIEVHGTEKHNTLHVIFRRKQLPEFLARVLDE